ncbi:uncharacterized protein si:ch211-13c6.2 isoform X2 [Siniperca chuatsi]|uniref:uncharacterized protein si:ch211-13c6.2 isoform X2 n=1 Tax=Siniperca chuatsi TaxID=119488 RepID=UPI001CE10805|nr:uncharacterized protein si:ch211-13c6.2 isoform X2 [Siniperca chuatsi]
MDNIETPYDDEAEFIECKVCDKSIRGNTLYKIHLTTPGHIKKEDVVVAAGLAVRQHTLPVFEDIVQYLDYMKLDEPIIGLNYLDEVPCNDPQAGPRYTCRLCHQTANLQEMVRHLIGRKHRQKYVELKRPDLVTWDKQSIVTQGGKIIRARAVIIERQDGRGTPLLMAKKGMEGKLNISRVPPKHKQNGDRNISQSLTQRDMSSHLPELNDHKDKYSHRGRYPPNTPQFHSEDPYMLNRDRQIYQREDSLSHDRMEEKLWRANEKYSPEYMDADYRRYEEEYVEDPQRRAVLGLGGVPRYDSSAEMPHGQAQHVEYYPEEAPPYRRPYPERDPLKEFYSEEVRRGRVRSAENKPSQPVFPEGDNHRWSLDRESGRHDSMNIAGRQGSSEPEAKRRSFPTPIESDRSRDHLCNMIRDYCHEMREPHQEEAVSNPGPSRTGPPTSQRGVEVTRAISDIPEPFRRFLKGAANDEGHGKRKRKSRFSDATAEEVETTKEMFSDEHGPPNPKFGGHPRPVSAPLRPEIYGTQHPDLYIESQSAHHTESYQRGRSESEGVFDMLRNSQGRVISKDYNSLKPDPELSPRRQYEKILREDSDLRRPEDTYFKEDHRGRDWKQHEHIPDERLQEYHHPVRGEPRHSNRSRYEEVFGWPDMSRTPHATHPDEPARYPERFQEPMHPCDYRPAAEEFLDSHSSAPPLHIERGPRMDRGPRYSNNLDKITSTLLELVARK